MATWYVNSAVVGGTGNGNTWANACPTMTQAIANSAAGDDFNVWYQHNETSTVAVTHTYKGTASSPNRVFSCTSANSPAQASDLIAGATINTTGSGTIAINGDAYINGIIYNAGSGANVSNISVATVTADLYFDNCDFNLPSTLPSYYYLNSGTNRGARVTFANTSVSFANTSSAILSAGGVMFFWKNTPSAVGGSIVPNTLFGLIGTGKGSTYILDGVDLSALGSGKAIVASVPYSNHFQINNCKLGASVVVSQAPSAPGSFVDLINSDSSATGYRQERYQFAGTQLTDTSITLNNGANDGVQAISWKVTTSASNTKQTAPFECFDIVQWNTSVGITKTATVQLISNTALTNSDIWVECLYLGNASVPGASFVSSAPASVLTANTALATSTAIWSNSPTKPQQISVSFIPQMQGLVRIKLKVGRSAASVIWIDPEIVIS